jgi:hypothetical protein
LEELLFKKDPFFSKFDFYAIALKSLYLNLAESTSGILFDEGIFVLEVG